MTPSRAAVRAAVEAPRRQRPAGRPAWLYRWLFLLPALAYVAMFFVYPIAKNVVMGFQAYTSASFYTGEAPFVGVSNYSRAIDFASFLPTLRNTLLFTVGSVCAQFCIGLLVAVFFRRRFPLSTLLRSLLLLPWLLPVIVSTALWRSLFDQDHGAVNLVLKGLGLIDVGVPWLSSPGVALLSVVLVNVWIGIPFNVAILYSGLQDIPEELTEAAAVDGAGRFRAFTAITWPLLRPTVTVVLLLGVIYTLRSLDVVLGLTGGGPANSTQTLSTLSYFSSFQSFDFGMGAAISNILIVISLIFAMLYLRSARNSVEA